MENKTPIQGKKDKLNYAKQTEEILDELQKKEQTPRILLHSCCAPCSSHVMEYLRERADVTVFYYNPNITEEKEYEARKAEEIRLIAEYNEQTDTGDFSGMHSTPLAHRIEVLDADYHPDLFFRDVEGYEDCKEGGARCEKCFALRLSETAKKAKEKGFDFFTTTLTISPLKNAELINAIGIRLGEEEGIPFLPSDFKKKDGYKRSLELSERFHLYRQDYCGCIYSKKEREERREKS